MTWVYGPPTEPGHYWIVQYSHGVIFGPAYAFVIDGYPDGLYPPASFRHGDDAFKEWDTRWAAYRAEHGSKFLRIRTVEGFGAGDHELRKYPVDAHMKIEVPEVPE